MPAPVHQITIPNVKLELAELLALIRGLDADARREIATALADSEMDARLEDLIHQLASRPAIDELSDADLEAEVRAVRSTHQRP
jgi:hypothetical protein